MLHVCNDKCGTSEERRLSAGRGEGKNSFTPLSTERVQGVRQPTPSVSGERSYIIKERRMVIAGYPCCIIMRRHGQTVRRRATVNLKRPRGWSRRRKRTQSHAMSSLKRDNT